MRIHYLQHVPFEDPGYIRSWAGQHNIKLTGTHLYKSDPLPSPQEIEGLVVMGGPMGVHDMETCPWLKEEKQFIKRCIDQHIKMMGICLGAQLIADVLDAKVTSMDQKEIGWYPLSWRSSARNHPLLDFLPAQQTVLHWHGDEFDLPEGALPLGTTEACTSQGFLIKNYILGLQFHLEMTKDGLSKLIKNSGDELNTSTGPFIQSPEKMLKAPYFDVNHTTMTKLLNRFFLKSMLA